jgi:hypothetical protein
VSPARPGPAVAAVVAALVLPLGIAQPASACAESAPAPPAASLAQTPRTAAAVRPTPDAPGEATLAATSAPRGAPVPFAVGEVLQYDLAWSFLNAGTMRLAVEGVEQVGDRDAYLLSFQARTNRTISTFYSLENLLRSWMDVERLHSLRFVKESVEKGKQRDRSYRLDQERHVRIDEETGEEEPMPAGAQDDASIFYFMRLLPLADGKRFTLNNLMDPDDNPMKVSVLGKESVRVPAGTFDAWVLRLDVDTDSGAFSQGGELTVWMTRDERRLPVKLESKLPVGTFTASLREYRPGSRTPAATGTASTAP